jgi:hypothetical protein
MKTRKRMDATSLEAELTEVRSALKRRMQNVGEIGSIVALYGSIMSLCARAKRLCAIIRSHTKGGAGETVRLDQLVPTEVREFTGFFDELLEFGGRLGEVNLAVIDIYYPGLKEDLLDAVGTDIVFINHYSTKIAPKYGLSKKNRHRSFSTFSTATTMVVGAVKIPTDLGCLNI